MQSRDTAKLDSTPPPVPVTHQSTAAVIMEQLAPAAEEPQIPQQTADLIDPQLTAASQDAQPQPSAEPVEPQHGAGLASQPPKEAGREHKKEPNKEHPVSKRVAVLEIVRAVKKHPRFKLSKHDIFKLFDVPERTGHRWIQEENTPKVPKKRGRPKKVRPEASIPPNHAPIGSLPLNTQCELETLDPQILSAMAQVQPTSNNYIHGHHPSVLRSHIWRTAANSCAYLLPHLKPTDKILDIGCGPGTISVDLASHVPHGSVTGLDTSPAVLEQARQHAHERRVPNVEFGLGDIFKLPYADDTFDIVHAHQVLQHVPAPVAALAEMRRVTRRGGLVAARESDMSACSWHPSPPRNGLARFIKTYLKIAESTGGTPTAGKLLHVWARDAGFAPESVASSAATWCFASPEDVQWWSGLWAERTVESEFRERALAAGVAPEELERLAEAWREWGRSDAARFVVLHGEVLCRK
ncbi:hypothetical protein B0A49_11171 [Cryomyces minteri]|uniref:Methyltransferase domain-containing protein n=1 Tax=Cryomyces minteri TaxID=331657 RepID=A0A4U0WKG6_9PEZI|nr:hypothetical protein B0A49_11171 [Cryomyces minteri]